MAYIWMPETAFFDLPKAVFLFSSALYPKGKKFVGKIMLGKNLCREKICLVLIMSSSNYVGGGSKCGKYSVKINVGY